MVRKQLVHLLKANYGSWSHHKSKFIFCLQLCLKMWSRINIVLSLQDFAKNKAIPQGEDQVVYFPPVWDWSQQFSSKDITLFNNPMYVGKGAACVQNGEVKTFRRTKVTSQVDGSSNTLYMPIWVCFWVWTLNINTQSLGFIIFTHLQICLCNL